ncbi:MAG TPA: hypothetical protein VKX16_15565 [Chloroflexota bacterium]|nr:hypothetical protein [Chloroflexota bacterium]
MALMRNRPAAIVRRITLWSLVADVGVGVIVAALISHVIGFILFLIGLALTGLFNWNMRQVMRYRGMR